MVVAAVQQWKCTQYCWTVHLNMVRVVNSVTCILPQLTKCLNASRKRWRGVSSPSPRVQHHIRAWSSKQPRIYRRPTAKLREVEWQVWGHRTSTWQSWDLNPQPLGFSQPHRQPWAADSSLDGLPTAVILELPFNIVLRISFLSLLFFYSFIK